MCAILSDVEGADKIFQELLAFFKVSRALEIDASGAVQQDSNVYFSFTLLGRERYKKYDAKEAFAITAN